MLAGQETSRTCRDQGWDGRDPLCERMLVLTFESNMILKSTKPFPVCIKIFFVCVFEVNTYSHDIFFSLAVKCSAPPDIENGQLEDEPFDSYDYLQAVSYRCNGGHNLIGQSTLHCSEDGTFKPDPPKCFGKLWFKCQSRDDVKQSLVS